MNNINHQKSLAQKILEEIHNGPPQIPRYYFFIKNSGFWILTLVSSMVGGLIVSALMFWAIDMSQHDPEVPPDGPEVLLYIVPIIWIILFSTFVYLAYKATRKTELGYKYKLSTLIISLLFVTIFSGLIFYLVGVTIFFDLNTRHLINY